MLPPGGRVLVALSGGPDSVVLLHVLQTLERRGHLDEAPRVGDLPGHFDRELERVGDGGCPPRVRSRAMRTIEGRVDFHPCEALGISLQVPALRREGMGVLGRNRPPRAAHPEQRCMALRTRHAVALGGTTVSKGVSAGPARTAPVAWKREP